MCLVCLFVCLFVCVCVCVCVLRRVFQEEDSQWVLKAPFTTNSKHYLYYPKNAEEAVAHVISVAKRSFHDAKPGIKNLPYLMLQRRVNDKTEVKLVFFNGVFSHIANGVGKSASLQGYSTLDLANFACGIIDRLSKSSSVPFILDGLIRVDLFKGNEGELVVNELESLEAMYSSQSCSNGEDRIDNHLAYYWEMILYELICELLPTNEGKGDL